MKAERFNTILWIIFFLFARLLEVTSSVTLKDDFLSRVHFLQWNIGDLFFPLKSMVRCYIRQKSAKAFHAALGYWCHYGVGGTGWVQCCLLGVGLLFVLGEAGGAGIKVGLHEAEFCSSLYFLTAVTKFFSPWGLCFLSNDGEVVRIPVRNSLSQGPGHRPFPATQLPVTQSSCVEMASELSRFQRSCFISSWQPEPGRGGVSPGRGVNWPFRKESGWHWLCFTGCGWPPSGASSQQWDLTRRHQREGLMKCGNSI